MEGKDEQLNIVTVTSKALDSNEMANIITIQFV